MSAVHGTDGTLRIFGVETRRNERRAGQGDGAAYGYSPPWPFTVKSSGWTGY
ncbi:MAG: hypothetical protein R6U13_06130 [Desulfatiglandaceae bacterium]